MLGKVAACRAGVWGCIVLVWQVKLEPKAVEAYDAQSYVFFGALQWLTRHLDVVLGHSWQTKGASRSAQVEKLSNELLDSCDQFRESMGEVTDNVSLAVALETLWSERIENSSSGKPSCISLFWGCSNM